MPKVEITAEELVYYHRTIEMSDEDFAEYNSAVARREDDKWFARFAERWLGDPEYISDSDGLEEVRVDRAKAETKAA